MQTLFVSILIPTYNQQMYITKAVESALAQSYRSLEIIVVDDHGTDETQQLVATYLTEDSRLRYVRNEKNLGRVANYRNALYNLAKGDYVVMLDGDDYFLDPRFIESCIKEIQSQPEEIIFVKCNQAKFKTWKNKPAPQHVELQRSFQKTTAGDYLKHIQTFGFSHLANLYHRQHAIKADFYSKNISSSDMDSFFRLCLLHDQSKVLVGNLIAGVWVKHENNASSSVIDWNDYSASCFRLYYNTMRNPVGQKIGIGWLWVLKMSVKPLAAYILRRIGFHF